MISKLPRKQIDRALKSVARFKKNFTRLDKFSESAFQKIDTEIWDLRVATLGEERAKQRSAQKRTVSPGERFWIWGGMRKCIAAAT
jgi:hypothetical protein